MHELFWTAYEQLSDQGLAAAAVTRLFDDNEGQYQHRPMRQVQPQTVSRYLSLGTRLVQFLLLLEAMPAPDPSSFLGQVLASRGPAVINATAALRAGLDAEMTKKELVEPLTSLWLALVEVELSLFDNDKVHFVNVFLLCTAVSKGSGILQDIRQWTTTPAGLLYVFKLFLLRRGKNESWLVANELRPYMQPGRLVHFLSQRMSMARTASVAEGQAGVDVDIRADGDVTDETLRTIVYRGIELNVEELGAALEQMRKDMTEILDKQLLLDSRLRKDYEKEYERLRLKEDRTNRVKNWWVGHGSPAENALFDHIGQTPSLRQEFIRTEHGSSGELTFREDRVRVCRHEPLCIKGCPTKTALAGNDLRFFAEKQLSILTRVSKTYWLSLNEQHTFRYMDQEISTLIFMYLLLCKPLEHMLSSWLQKRGGLDTPDDENGIHNAEQDDEDFLDDELDEDHMSHDETMTLRREVRDARNHYNNSHLLFNIAPLQAMTTSALGSLIHTQAQHSGDTAQRAYARTASDHVQTKMSSRLMHQVASQKWHALFGLDHKRSIAELTANQEALEARYPISWNPVTDLSPEANGRIIMNTRAEHDVPYMTQLAKQASISWGHSFNSQEQLDLAAAIDQHRPEDGWLIVVAPTGMGKTFCTLPKLGCRPHAGTVLWIVPFVAVANDLLRRFQGAGHSAQRWLGPSTQVADGLDVLIVTTDMFVRVGSESLHGKVCFQRIRTVVMDEAHTLISDASYRDVMDEVAASVGSGGWTNIKRVALTGTLCIGDQEHLFRKLGQQVGGKVYRLETMRRDLQLRVLHGNQLNFLSHVQAIVDTQRVMRQANGKRVHMMVFCDTVNEVKLLCDQLHAYGYMALPYYTDLEEKAQKDHVAQWQRGECDVIVATSCLSTGVDLLTIRHVLWYGNGYNVYTLAQAFGRAGRDKQGGTAELWLPVRRGPAPGMEKFVEGNACRSWALGKLLDPRAATCFAAGQPFCDVCAGTAQRLEPARAARQQRAAQALSVAHVEAEPEAMAEEEDVLSEPPAARLEEEESIGPESALDVASASNVETAASSGPAAVAAQSSRSTPRAQDTAVVATNAGPMTDAAVPRIQTSAACIDEADTASMSVPASPMVSDADDEAPLQQEARGSVQTTLAEGESTSQPVVQSAAQPTPTKHAPTPSASIICVPVPSASGSTSSPARSAASSASGTLRRKRVPLEAESTCTPGSDDYDDDGNGVATSPAPSTSKRTASDVTCTAAASSTAVQAAESPLPAAKRAASSGTRTATVAATATTRSEATVSAAATPPNRHNVAPIFRSKSGTKKKNLMNYAAADKFIGVLKLMDDYCMRCTIRQAKPVLKAEHQCVCNCGCKRCHLKGHETSECFVGFKYPKWTCCYACGMPRMIRGWDTWNHRCRQSQGLDSGLSCLLLYSVCHPGLRNLSQRMGYNLREQTLKDFDTRDLFVKWLYSSGPCPFPGRGHWRLVEFVFESARILLPSAAEAQVGPLDSFR
ncbi:uncharacterized protein MONBRDRAFT_9095 [Monosiga brevicollis MX1]|uniref:DNA helicase n=1 Tax=Monosiga brevicollis TaxID=81824 RepID=A9V226_MONBE|nr:uncharacterized protein MONBRDRAFT_9095 [Monosiga brevicollis MX1]EDQ88307.1 predicted protein [Monosiga brevicollis MX1]|eukprot:XP_001746900.1 hypothetical protein [Monosiga brevicollis MX1]